MGRYLNLLTFEKLKIFSKLKLSKSFATIPKHNQFILMKCSPKLLVDASMVLDNNQFDFFINIQGEPI